MAEKFITLPVKKNFLGIENHYSSYDSSKIVVLSCPYEKTTSYGKGTAKGPEAILSSSHDVEFFDEDTKKEICFSKGIAAIEPLSFRKLSDTESLDRIYNSVRSLLADSKFVVTL